MALLLAIRRWPHAGRPGEAPPAPTRRRRGRGCSRIIDDASEPVSEASRLHDRGASPNVRLRPRDADYGEPQASPKIASALPPVRGSTRARMTKSPPLPIARGDQDRSEYLGLQPPWRRYCLHEYDAALAEATPSDQVDSRDVWAMPARGMLDEKVDSPASPISPSCQIDRNTPFVSAKGSGLFGKVDPKKAVGAREGRLPRCNQARSISSLAVQRVLCLQQHRQYTSPFRIAARSSIANPKLPGGSNCLGVAYEGLKTTPRGRAYDQSIGINPKNGGVLESRQCLAALPRSMMRRAYDGIAISQASTLSTPRQSLCRKGDSKAIADFTQSSQFCPPCRTYNNRGLSNECGAARRVDRDFRKAHDRPPPGQQAQLRVFGSDACRQLLKADAAKPPCLLF